MDLKRIRNIVLATLLAVILLYVIYSRITGRVNIAIIPSDAVVTIDNKIVNTKKTITLGSGKHTLVAKMDGFTDYKTDFEIKAGSSKTIEVTMEYNNYKGYQWMLDHPQEQQELEGRSGRHISQQNEIMRADNPIISRLPYTDQQFRIDYGSSEKYPDSEDALAIYIQAYSPEGRQAALSWIKSQGYDISTMEIVFKDGSQ